MLSIKLAHRIHGFNPYESYCPYKYCPHKILGEKNTELNLPTTSSLSLTLDKFYTTTSVEPANHDRFILNDQVVDATRVHRFLDILRQQLGDFTPLQVISENHVPTSAGLASSASAFAALTGAVTHELGMDLPKEELSRLARRGSGSASRSFLVTSPCGIRVLTTHLLLPRALTRLNCPLPWLLLRFVMRLKR